MAADPSTGIKSVRIHEIADVVPLPGFAELSDRSTTAVTSSAGVEPVAISDFPVLADAAYAGQILERRRKYAHYKVRPVFLMSIPGCTLAGAHLIALKSGSVVHETVRGGRSFRDRRIFSPTKDGGYALTNLAAGAEVPGSSLVVGGKAVSGYFHWMTEIVPRLVAARRHPELRDLPVVMRPHDRDFQKETLEWLGVRPSIVTDDLVRLERAVIPSFPIHGLRNGRYGSELVPLMREFAIAAPPSEGPTPSLLYVSREDVHKRRISNERAVQDMLTSIGFMCVTLDGLSVAAQIRMFAGARTVVAQHGAGLTNIAFARAGTRVIELYPRGFFSPSPFWTFASLAGLRYAMLVCGVDPATVPDDGEVKDADLIVDVDALRRSVLAG